MLFLHYKKISNITEEIKIVPTYILGQQPNPMLSDLHHWHLHAVISEKDQSKSSEKF